MTDSAELIEARQRLKDAIDEIDSLVGLRDGVPREATEIMTHYIVLHAWSQFNDDGSDDGRVAWISSGNMPIWQMRGLLLNQVVVFDHITVCHGEND